MSASTLNQLTAGQEIPYGGNRVTVVSPELAAAFQPGDRLIVVQETGDLLRVPAEQARVAAEAVERAHRAFQAMGSVSDDAITDFFEAFAARLEDEEIWS